MKSQFMNAFCRKGSIFTQGSAKKKFNCFTSPNILTILIWPNIFPSWKKTAIASPTESCHLSLHAEVHHPKDENSGITKKFEIFGGMVGRACIQGWSSFTWESPTMHIMQTFWLKKRIQRGSLRCQPNKCTMFWGNPWNLHKFTLRLHCLISPKWCNLMTPDKTQGHGKDRVLVGRGLVQ